MACSHHATACHGGVQFYVPWNVHELTPGVYKWDGAADVEAYLKLIDELGMHVLLRFVAHPSAWHSSSVAACSCSARCRLGPYICAEWDFGGFPWWLASSQVIHHLLADLHAACSEGASWGSRLHRASQAWHIPELACLSV